MLMPDYYVSRRGEKGIKSSRHTKEGIHRSAEKSFLSDPGSETYLGSEGDKYKTHIE